MKGRFWYWTVILAQGNYTENHEWYLWNLMETLEFQTTNSVNVAKTLL